VIGFALFAPVLMWNEAHGWVGFVKQGGRVEDWRPARAVGFLAELVGGQIGLATPLVWVLCMIGLVVAVRRAWRSRDPGWSLLAALSLPPVLVFVQHAFGDRVQGNWPAIIYPALAIAAGGLLPRRRWWIGASALGFAITALAYIQATTGLLPLPPRLDPIAMRVAGWDNLAAQVRTLQHSTGATYVAADGYALASELAWWSLPDTRVVGPDERWTLTTLPTVPIAGQTGLLLRDSRWTGPPDPKMWRKAERTGTVTRGGLPGGDFVVYRVTSANNLAELPAR
jgi:hypothetical protein